MGYGDEVMVTGQVRELQELDPRKVRIVYEKPRWHEAWENNPRIARPGELGDFQLLRPRVDYRRPYIAQKTATQWTWKAWGPPKGELYFTHDEEAYGAKHRDRIVIEPRIKPGASPNKDWGIERWKELIRLGAAKGIQFTQLGDVNKYLLPGVKWVRTPTMRLAAAVLAYARAAVVPEGGLHHVCAAVGTPAVVIFGGYISPAVTGYPEQRSFFTGGALGCGMRIPCEHCKRAMSEITPREVLAALEDTLEKSRRSVAA
jgi:ADP-heptose:LPS heptosyltransferase